MKASPAPVVSTAADAMRRHMAGAPGIRHDASLRSQRDDHALDIRASQPRRATLRILDRSHRQSAQLRRFGLVGYEIGESVGQARQIDAVAGSRVENERDGVAGRQFDGPIYGLHRGFALQDDHRRRANQILRGVEFRGAERAVGAASNHDAILSGRIDMDGGESRGLTGYGLEFAQTHAAGMEIVTHLAAEGVVADACHELGGRSDGGRGHCLIGALAAHAEDRSICRDGLARTRPSASWSSICRYSRCRQPAREALPRWNSKQLLRRQSCRGLESGSIVLF